MPFLTPGLGYNSIVLMKHEAVAGTAASGAAEHASEIVSAEITPRLSTIIDPSLSNTQRSARFIGQGGRYFEWSVKVRAGYNGMLPWLRMMMPGYVATPGAGGDAAAIKHEFKEIGTGSPSVGGQWSYTIDINWGGVPSLAQPTRLVGAYATGMRFSAQAGTGENAMLMCEISGVCKSVTPGLAALQLTTVALPPALGVIYHQQLRTVGNFGDGTGVAADQISMKSFECNITSPFDTQRFLFGQVNAEAPVPNGIMDVTFNMELEWTETAQMLSMLNGGGATIKYLFQNPTTIVGAATAKPEFEITALSPTAAEYSTAIPGFGVVTQKLGHKCAFNSAQGTAVYIRVQSIQAAMTF